MKKGLGCAALSCALGLANSKALRWTEDEPRWHPAQETLGYMPSLGLPATETPLPTPAPSASEAAKRLDARSTGDNTCGFISGLQQSSLWCAATAHCVYNSLNSHIGCCDDTATFCPVWTRCYDSTDRSSFTSANGYTVWCGDSSYPHCITHMYQDALVGYTLLGCAVAAGTDKIWYTPLVFTSSSTTAPTTTHPITTPTTPATTAPVTTSPAPTPTPDSGGSSPPVGPIVGGVVGGLGAIALIVLGIWALLRHNDKQKKSAAAAAAAAAAAQPPPNPPHDPNQQQQQPLMAGYYDPRASMAKPPVAGVPYANTPGTTVYDPAASPPHSPPPPGYHPQGTPSPPPQQQGGYPNLGAQVPAGGYGYEQQQQQQQQYGYAPQQGYPQQQQGYAGYGQPGQPVPVQQQGGYTAELSAQRGDGELRELA